MFKTALIIISFLLLIAAILLLMINNNRSVIIEQQREEIEALTNYVQSLRNRLDNYEQAKSETTESSRDTRIRDLLDDYLRTNNNQNHLIDTTITTDELREELEEFRWKQQFIPDQMPIIDKSVISQSYSENHKGVDMAASLGTEVVAAGSGVIRAVYEDRYFGNVVVIDHLNSYQTFYAHLARIFYKPGYFVQKGEAIGLVGNTGYSTHPHLHFEVMYQDENINPIEIINK